MGFKDITIQDVALVVLTLLVLYVLYKIRNLEKCENRENFAVSDDVKAAINEIYKADINAIRNLSDFANTIKKADDTLTLPSTLLKIPGVIVPGDGSPRVTVRARELAIQGNIQIDGKALCIGNMCAGENDLYSLLPKGSIVAFYGGNIPPRWAICDGTNGTPDLRSRFIIGATPGDIEPAKLANGLTARNFGGNGGSEAHTLTIDEMPSHNHQIRWANGGYPGWRWHSVMATDRDGPAPNDVVANAGGSLPHNNMPPYLALYYIMRL